MHKDTIDIYLPSAGPEESGRECRMSAELYQNARQTAGELRDFLRETGLSWEFIQSQIDRMQASRSPIEKALDRMDEFTTSPAASLRDKDPNVW